ncbi:MAG: hypothetical protein CBD03_04930 [Rhizobiales bacterium TMED143]|nr:hypothetical protein [Rhodobiaceae bacterium]OUV91671.1 MAG: hypothetical protein CBD03_04930 [Rhizobiales bacterium TMED143]
MSDLPAEPTVSIKTRKSTTLLQLFSFAIPTVGAGYMFCLVSLYLMKFATDVLLIAPAIMGFIFGVSRFWDAVSDPLVGYLSDKTRSRWGRRRPWIFASVLPVGLSFWMLLAPPDNLSDNLLVAWMAVAVIGFYSAQTMFVVPHMALGAELTDDYHERNKIFGARHAGWIAGYISALATMYWLILAEGESSQAVRSLAAEQSTYAAAVTGVMLLVCVMFVRERPEFTGRGAENPFTALRDIMRNRHASLLIFIIFIENLGGAVITILTLYNAEYVLNAPQMAPFFILSYMVFSFLLTPIWMPIARRIGKKRLWFCSMLVTAFAFGSMGFLQEGDDIVLLVLAAIAGAAGSCGGTINPSIKSDVIDYDELQTGERKEGAYFSAWYFVSKSAYGIMLMVTGFALSWAGFVPKAVQTDQVVDTLRFLYAGVPFFAYIFGALMFLRFSLNEAEHAEVIAELERQGKR